MDWSEAQERYTSSIWERVQDTAFPSPPMLDRLERQLRSREDAEAYLDLLFDKADGQYPSQQLMGRIDRVTEALRVLDLLEERSRAA